MIAIVSMKISKMIPLKRLQNVYRDLGPVGFGLQVLERLRYAVGLSSPFFRHVAEVDATFDTVGKVDTGGVHRLTQMTIVGRSVDHGSGYIACDPDDFNEAMQALPPVDDFTFVDLGSGKGRALMLAGNYSFRRIIGVEFSNELHNVAQANFRKQPDPRVELVLADCLDFIFPLDPLVLYLYNPFDEPLVRAVARRVMGSWRDRPRSIFVVYLNPRHGQCWFDEGWRIASRSTARPALRQPWIVYAKGDWHI
jgi:hypothetical protein